MDAEEIVAQVNVEGGPPQNWIVFPLLKSKVAWGIAGWVAGVLVGLLLLYVVVPIVIPYNFTRGAFAIIITLILLSILAFIFIGSLIMLVVDSLRLMHPERHMIVLTESDFVKKEGVKTIQVPLVDVLYVTPRGRAPIDRTPAEANADVQGSGENMVGFLFGRYVTPSGQKQRRKRMRTPTSLAFIDRRTNKEVTVVNDNAYGDPFMIAEVLKEYVTSVHASPHEVEE